MDWFNENKMIVNPRKFKTLITDMRKQDHTNEIFKISPKEIKAASQVKLLEAEIYHKLNSKQHINHIFKSAANQLNTLTRLKRFLSFQERKVLVNSLVLSILYCNT